MPQILERAFKNPARALALVTLFLLVVAAGPAFAQGTGAPANAGVPAISDSVTADTAAIAMADTGAAAAGLSGVDRIAEIRAGFTPENKRYARIRATLGFVSPLIDILIALVLLTTGASAWMRDVAHARFKRRYPRPCSFISRSTCRSASLLGLPARRSTAGFALEHQFGLSNQSFGAWLGDQGKERWSARAARRPVCGARVPRDRQSPRRWWLWLALATLPCRAAASCCSSRW